jgi:hypothetical protein
MTLEGELAKQQVEEILPVLMLLPITGGCDGVTCPAIGDGEQAALSYRNGVVFGRRGWCQMSENSALHQSAMSYWGTLSWEGYATYMWTDLAASVVATILLLQTNQDFSPEGHRDNLRNTCR